MPYVEKYDRDRLDFYITNIESCGELNYIFTKLIVEYVKYHGKSYQTCNDVVGALDNAKDEFRRRIQHPYEDYKIKSNGDVYTEIL